MSAFDELCQWYQAQCDGEWEHGYGIVIETMDDPGWWVKIDLRDTILEFEPFARIEAGDPDEDASWIVCNLEGTQWHGMGDPARLNQIIQHFVSWAKQRPDWLRIPNEAALQNRDDAELWGFLGKSLGAEMCRINGCHRRQIRHSIYCRTHHWEHVLQRPCPFEEA